MIVLTRSDNVTVQLEVLTLDEAAAFLRVREDALLALAIEGAVPAQKIGDDWRFLKEGLGDWLRYGQRFYRENPGSKQAVQKHFGVWREDPTAEALLADIYKRRQEEPGSEE